MSKQVGSFAFHHRNPGHWDVIGEEGRLFAIRGEPGSYFIRDERKLEHFTGAPISHAREGGAGAIKFPDLPSAAAWITSTLMKEI